MRLSRVSLLLAVLSMLACSGSATGPSAAALAGTYVLTAPVARGGPVEGTIVLTRSGVATRSVKNDGSWGGGQSVLSGSFAPVGENEIELRFETNSGGTAHIWAVRATVERDELEMSYPHPADGWAVERYRKVAMIQGIP
jgi:hypothetical protein